MAIKVETVSSERFKMKFFKFGSGVKPAVIIPGLSPKGVSESAESVASRYKAMSGEYTVYVFDRRLDCVEGYNIEQMADDTAEAFNILGIKNAYVFGVSQGGMIAQYIAIKYPDLVKKLILCSTTAKITDENSGVIKNWIRLAQEKKTEELVDDLVKNVFSNEFYEKFGCIIKQMMIDISDTELDRFLIYANACKGFDVLDKLEKITCPVFVICSKKDKIFPTETSVEISERTNSELYIYENYGHAVYDEAPDFPERMIRFFAD